MRRFDWSSVEKSIYCLGLIGFIMLTAGIFVHMSCTGHHPCALDKWEKLSYYVGHICLIVAAFSYCIMPFLRKNKD